MTIITILVDLDQCVPALYHAFVSSTMHTDFLSENFRLKMDQIFEGLAPEQIDILIEPGMTHKHKKEEIIFRERGNPTGIYAGRFYKGRSGKEV